MGFADRDYYRDGRYSSSLSSWGVDLTPVVKWLIIINVAVFLLQIFSTRNTVREFPDLDDVHPGQAAIEEQDNPDDSPKAGPENEKARQRIRRYQKHLQEHMDEMLNVRRSAVQDWLELDPKKTIEKGQFWRLLTGAFCHDRYGVWHILFNMLMLYWFGGRLESMYGSREFLLFYLSAAIFSSLAYIGLAYYTESMTPAIGASGAVMGVMMLYTIFYPNEEFYIFCIIPVPLWVLLGIYIIYDLHPILMSLAGDRILTGVAHAGHLGGLLFGFLYWKFNWHLEGLLDRTAIRRPRGSFRRRTKLLQCAWGKRYEVADQVDEVLKKISDQGTTSLTPDEREILEQASREYRNKR